MSEDNFITTPALLETNHCILAEVQYEHYIPGVLECHHALLLPLNRHTEKDYFKTEYY